jgi:hypothetical protein
MGELPFRPFDVNAKEKDISQLNNKAYDSIGSVVYIGILNQFTFAQYVTIHQTAHNELEDLWRTHPGDLEGFQPLGWDF